MFFFFINLKEEFFESHSNILLFTLYFISKICCISTDIILYTGWEIAQDQWAFCVQRHRNMCLLAWLALLLDFLRTWRKAPAVLELVCLPFLHLLLLFVQLFVKGSQTLLLCRALELLHKQLAGLCYFLLVGRRHRRWHKRDKIFVFFFLCHHGKDMPSFFIHHFSVASTKVLQKRRYILTLLLYCILSRVIAAG